MDPQKVIDHFGGTQASAAKALGVAQSSIAEWVAKGEVPEGRQYQIEIASEGVILADKPAYRIPVRPSEAAA